MCVSRATAGAELSSTPPLCSCVAVGKLLASQFPFCKLGTIMKLTLKVVARIQ